MKTSLDHEGATSVTPSAQPARAGGLRLAPLAPWRGGRSGWSKSGAAIAAGVLAALLGACGGGQTAGSGATGTAAAAAAESGAAAAGPNASALATGATRADASASAPTNWTDCAREGQTCAFSGEKLVRYGSGTQYAVRTVTGGTPCTNAVFGDPIPNTVKACSYTDSTATPAFDPSLWTVCASEGGTCTFDGTRQVRYGTASQAVTREVAARTPCTNAVFGDPARGVVKTCWVAKSDASGPTETWTACAQENQFCAFTGTRAVRYGSGSSVATATHAGGVQCSNAVFGDPLPYVVKACSYSSIDTAAPAGPVVSQLTLAAVSAAVLGTPLQLDATVNGQSTPPPGVAIAWSVADPTIATVSASGLATPRRAGFTTVTASAGGKSASGTLTVRGPTPIPVRSQYVGTNVAGLAYYGSNFPFADLIKSGSSEWGSRDDQGKWGAPFPAVSADGYPTALAAGQHALVAVAWNGTRYPAGRYTVLWDGDGTLSFPMSNVRIVESAARRIVLEPVDTNGQMWVSIDATSAANPVRNVRFLLPGTESTYASQPFNPDYLQRIAPFSLLRFMDWGATNGSSVVEWADRAQPSNFSYATGKGVPIETMIDLANTLHVDPWFCIPHKASDDYVRQFATLVRTRLDPTLRPHIEYSNEVWNAGFAQNAWASQQADALRLARPYGLPSLYYAKRAVQMFKIVQSVYGPTDAPRLVRVLAGQAAWTQFMQDVLSDPDAAANADVMAIAPYFEAEGAANPANADATLRLSASQVVDQMFTSVRGPVKSWMTANAALAARYRLKMKAYEAGPGDSTWAVAADKQDAIVALFTAANSHPRMKDLYLEYYAQWKAAGGDTMNQYFDVGGWSKYGYWGALQGTYYDVPSAPKYQGLVGFIAANPQTTQQTTLNAGAGK